ncbi:MAG: EAL domain-containing protein [Steroidobacteraceae bacterium]
MSGDRVLIADDDVATRLLMRTALTQAGFNVIEVTDGEAAVAACREWLPHAVLLDVEMPGMDGFASCAAIRALEGIGDVPVMMVTGRDDVASVELAYQAGATDFVAKPLNWGLLGHRVRYLIRGGKTRQALLTSERRNAALLDALPDPLLLVDGAGALIAKLGGGGEGRVATDLVLSSLQSAPRLIDAGGVAKVLQQAREQSEPLEFELPVRAQSPGGQQTFEVRCVAAGADEYMLLLRDITERKRDSDRITQLAYFDDLTGLPNRQRFSEILQREINAANLNDARLGLLYVDLDNLKHINDTLGLAVGDAVIKSYAARLETLLMLHGGTLASPTVARFGGDEFMLLLPSLKDTRQALQLAERILAVSAEPMRCGEHEVLITVTVGIAVTPDHGTESADLMRNAVTALHSARDGGRNRLQLYHEPAGAALRDRIALQNDLRLAVAQNQLALVYQPQLEIKTGRVVGVECLLRWHHPQRGPVPPSAFVPLAEESSLIMPLSDWVLQEALRQVLRWQREGFTDLAVAVNVSSKLFSLCSVSEWVSCALRDAGVAGSALEIEVTESALLHDRAVVMHALAALADNGVRTSLDDFGTGYSSLSYLKDLQLDTLKIDRSFIADIADSPSNSAICGAIIAMAHRLGLKVVAEGIETLEQLAMLRLQGCDMVQGYFVARPMPAEQCTAVLQAARSRNLSAGGINLADLGQLSGDDVGRLLGTGSY